MTEISTRKQSILFVDDNGEIRRLYQKLLESSGYIVEVASDGQEAIDAYSQREIDLVIMDLEMPGVSGAEALETIHKLNNNVKAIVISRHLITAREDLEGFGVKEFLTKPLGSIAFLEKVAKVIGQ